MNVAMELHDSRILAITLTEDHRGEILFRAVIYRSEGEPGKDAQISGWQNVRMRFTGMTILGELGRIGITQTDVYGGKLSAASKIYGGFFSTQTLYESPINLSMLISNDDDYRDIEICAAALQISLEGDFVPEHVWDNDGNLTPFVG